MNRTDRLHAIHEALRRAGRQGSTAARLAEDLEVSVRTIKRDVSALQQTGVPIWARNGPGGGYRLDASATMPPVAFTPAQAVAAAVALAILPPASPFGVDARAAADKLLDTLSPSARERARDLAERVWVMHDHRPRSTAPTILRQVERSLSDRVALTMVYRRADAAASDGVSKRIVEPVMLAWANRCWYLVAHCRLRNDIRWFRLDRIQEAHCLGQRYEPRPVGDIGRPPDGAMPVARGS